MEIYNRDYNMESYTPRTLMPVSLLLENLRSAFNVGSIFRTADAFRLEKLFLAGYTACPPNSKLKKTALGAEEMVDWDHIDDIYTHIEVMKRKRYTVYSLERTSKSRILTHTDIKFPALMVFGNEVTGISPGVLEVSDTIVEIPMYGYKNSLNVATAAGIVLYRLAEIWRMNSGGSLSSSSFAFMH